MRCVKCSRFSGSLVDIDCLGAFVLQKLVMTYEEYYTRAAESTQSANADAPGKECSNLLVLLTSLYSFQVVSCLLVYDIIRSLLHENLNELNVELLMKIVRG